MLLAFVTMVAFATWGLNRRRSRTVSTHSSEIALEELCVPDDWEFKSEGNLNVVFTYVGRAGALMGKVLRVQKLSTDGVALDETGTDFPGWWPADPLTFASSVLAPLLPGFVLPAQYVEISESFLNRLQEILAGSPKRSGSRLGRINSRARRVVLMRDLTAGPVCTVSTSGSVLCVELKPKWGVLPQPGAGGSDPRSRWSRHCMHQVCTRDKLPVVILWVDQYL